MFEPNLGNLVRFLKMKNEKKSEDVARREGPASIPSIKE